MSGFDDHRRDWQDMAANDPLWAVASSRENRHGGWDDDAFMEKGRRKADKLLARVGAHGLPAQRGRALDVGCGVGRLLLPLAQHFEEAVGVDVAPAMLKGARARATAAGTKNVRLLLDEAGDLSVAGTAPFDLVLCSLVLQHQPSREQQERMVRALARLTARDGVLVVQVPTYLPLRMRAELGRRLYSGLRRGRVPGRLLLRVGLHPMRMRAVAGPTLEAWLVDEGLTVVSRRERERSDGTRHLEVVASPSSGAGA